MSYLSILRENFVLATLIQVSAVAFSKAGNFTVKLYNERSNSLSNISNYDMITDICWKLVFTKYYQHVSKWPITVTKVIEPEDQENATKIQNCTNLP